MTEATIPELGALFDLRGRTALVVGAGSGIGRAAARGLAAFGASVVCADVNADAVATVASEIRDEGGDARDAQVDMTDAASVTALADQVTADVLVVTPAINVRKRLLDMTDDEFERVVGLNLRGTFRMVRAVARGMAERGDGSIIVFSSIRAMVVEPGQGVYAATKAGVVQLVRTLAAELGPQGVRVNVIAPGVVETPLTRPIQQNAEWYGAYAAKTVFGRWSTPDELVGAVIFLASRASSYVTGSYLLVDGGWTAADGRFSPPL